MILILELATLALAIAFCVQQLKALLSAKAKNDYDAKRYQAGVYQTYDRKNYEAGCYEVRWH